MSLAYRVYKGDASGGPVDYSTAVATVPGLGYVGAALAPSSRTRFAVRAYDSSTGLDDGNLDVVAEVVLDASGADVSATPAPVTYVEARAKGVGSAEVRWVHHPAGRARPVAFDVFATAGGSVDFDAAPAATASFSPAGYEAAGGRFRATVSGLTAGTTYSFGVRARAAAGRDSGTLSATATPVASGPLAPSGLTLAATQPAGPPTGRAIPGTMP